MSADDSGTKSHGAPQSSAETTRRRLLKGGALLVPAVLTLRATPAWAQTDYTITAYRYGANAGKCRNPNFNPSATEVTQQSSGGATGPQTFQLRRETEPEPEFFDCPSDSDRAF